VNDQEKALRDALNDYKAAESELDAAYENGTGVLDAQYSFDQAEERYNRALDDLRAHGVSTKEI